MARVIGREELRARLERGDRLVLVEALDPREFRKFHLPGALNLPWQRVRERAAELLPDRDAEIVVYCAVRTCDAATKALLALEDMGYENLYHYLDGKHDWREAGLPVETPGARA